MLRISLLGTFDVRRGDVTIAEFRAQSARALLAYLCLERDRPHDRAHLCQLLWPDAPVEQALANLRQSIHRLREALDPGSSGIETLLVSRHNVQLHPEAAIWTDADAFGALIVATQQHAHRRLSACPSCLAHLREAVELYRGNLLPGLSGPGGLHFDEWLLMWRERLHHHFVVALDGLAEHHERRGEHEPAARYLRRWLALEPWREIAHRRLIATLAGAGDRSGALRQFERCAASLAAEIGVAPAFETQQLAAQIRSGQLADRLRRKIGGASHSLPTEQRAPLIGREQELATAAECLLNPNCRLLTIVGAGGSGKSCLALRVADAAKQAFAEGVCWIDAGSSDGEQLAEMIVAALGGQPTPNVAPAEQLLELLRGRELLLVLDNLEQVRGGATLVAQMVAKATGVVVLATSRVALRLRAEWRLPLGGLGLPSTSADCADAAAGRLFAQVARQVAPSFAPSPADWQTIGEMCAMFNGLPLAIELAATRLAWMRLDDLAAGLRNDPASLATSLADLPERHRSVRAVFDDSWALLNTPERELLGRLASLPEQFSLAAAGVACGAIGEDELTRLVEASLVVRVEGGYVLPVVTRQLAAERYASKRQQLLTAESAKGAEMLSIT